jgi:hypothetical protein
LPKVFSAKGSIIIPPAPFKKWWNYKELLGKSTFGKGGFRQQCPVRKLHVVVPAPPHPDPLPPSGGEGVTDLAGIINHKALNPFTFFPSPAMGERVRVRGK